MGDDITIGVTEIVNNIEVTAQPNDQIVDISVIDNADDVTLNITPTVIEINVNKGSSYAKWGTILGTLSDQTDLQDALDLKADLVDGKVPSSQLPSYVDDVIEVANYAALPATGETGKIYVTIDNNKIFRWTGSTYVEIIDSAAVWGAITGTLSSQTDLQNALNLKANDNAVVKLTGDQSITGSKSFTTNTAAPAMVVTNNSTDNGILLQNTSTGRGITSNNVSTGIGIRSDNTGGGTGISSSNTGAGTGIVSTNTSTTGSALSISNSSTGYGILLTNSTGTGISSSNTGSGTGFYSNNSSTGNGIQSINSSSGYGISSSNTGSGRGIYSSNNSTGDAINIANSGSGRGIYLTNASTGNSLILNNGTSATGMPFTVSKNGTDKFTINDAGEATGVKFIKSGGTSSQFLKADGSIDSTSYQAALTNPVTGTGTTNYIPKFTGSSAIGNSLIYDNGTNIEIGGGIITNKSGGTFWQSKNGATNYFIIGNDSTIAGGSVSDINYYAYLGNQIFSTGGSERMRITSSGNVGIGTTSPSRKLYVNGQIGLNDDLISENGANVLRLGYQSYYGSGGFNLTTEGSVPLTFGTASIEKMRITSGGSVGIGTSSPSEKLSVVGGNISLGAGYKLQYSSTAYMTPENNVSGAEIATGGILTIKTGGTTERVRVDASGNVGIGTTSPSSKLHVLGKGIFDIGSSSGDVLVVDKLSGGNIAFNINGVYSGQIGAVGSGDLYIASKSTYPAIVVKDGGNVGIGTTSPNQLLSISSSAVGGSTFGLYNTASNTDNRNWALKLNANNYGDLGFFVSSSNGGNPESGSIPMLINKSGNVGIGTNSPTSKLQVVGLPSYADNTTALAGGLTVGAFYHTAGILKVVI